MSSKIEMKPYWRGGECVVVQQKDFLFGYHKPAPEDLKRQGRRLDITLVGKKGEMTITLNGTQINTIKKILQVAGELD